MAILIGCEESQVITNSFRKRGYEAYSCDLQPTRGNSSWHWQGDIVKAIPTAKWDLIILHPDCTAMAVSGNRYYANTEIRINAINWTLNLWKLAKNNSKRVALENPVSVIFKYLENVQYIQPWMFGHGECKKTGFALHNLPKLVATDVVEGREQKIWKMAPGINRKRDRSETYQGIADAIVNQWGKLLDP